MKRFCGNCLSPHGPFLKVFEYGWVCHPKDSKRFEACIKERESWYTIVDNQIVLRKDKKRDNPAVS